MNNKDFNSWYMADMEKRVNAGLQKDFDIRSVDPKNVEVLNEVIRRTQAKIVISSSWRHGWSLDEIKEALVRSSFQFPELIIGITPRHGDYRCRGREIKEWIEANGPIQHFVILDDDSDMAPIRRHLVQTSFETGLTEKHLKRILNRLTSEKWLLKD